MTDWLARALAEGTPLLDGDTAVFVYQGERPPTLIGDFTLWQRAAPLAFSAAGPGVWVARLPVPRAAYLEYALLVDGLHQPDPLNRASQSNGLGHTNSAFTTAGFEETPLAQPQPGVPRGALTTHALPTNELLPTATRTVQLYQPPTTAPCPLLVVLDGQDYAAAARLPTIVDNLIAAGHIRPVALALVTSGGPARRIEYACSDATLGFLVYRVLPLAQAQLNLVEVAAAPGAYGLMGASMGGLMSLYGALRVPEVFGHALIESCAIDAHLPAYQLYYRSVLSDLLACTAPPPLKLWLDCGQYEWFLEPNRRLVANLRARGYSPAYYEHPSGHNYVAWRNVLWRGLQHLYSP